MKQDFDRLSDPVACAALIMLTGMRFEATDGVTTVGDIVDALSLEAQWEEGIDEETRTHRTGTHYALLRIARANPRLRAMVIDKQSRNMGYHTDGLNAAAYTGPVGHVVAYLGTGQGEWNDNGVGLLGVPQTNTYYKYAKEGGVVGARIVEEHASTQQAQALDYFHRVTTELGWTAPDNVIVTGHSKGGNKAQFVALNSPLVKVCYSFCGQGFSPEAIEHYRELLGQQEYARRIRKIWSMSSGNDFVNVLGERVAPDDQIFYFDAGEVHSTRQYHEIYTIIGPEGHAKDEVPRGDLSHTAERLWRDARESPRRGATCMAVMTVCEHYFGNGVPLNGEFVSGKTLLEGGRTAVGILVRSIAASLLRAGVDRLSEDDRQQISSYYNGDGPDEKGGFRATMGGLIDRAMARMGRQKQSGENTHLPATVEIGAAEPFFRVDPATLRQAARDLEDTVGKTRALGERASGALTAPNGRNLADAVRRMQAETDRLEQCVAHLNETAQQFDQADAELAQLAQFVL